MYFYSIVEGINCCFREIIQFYYQLIYVRDGTPLQTHQIWLCAGTLKVCSKGYIFGMLIFQLEGFQSGYQHSYFLWGHQAPNWFCVMKIYFWSALHLECKYCKLFSKELECFIKLSQKKKVYGDFLVKLQAWTFSGNKKKLNRISMLWIS